MDMETPSEGYLAKILVEPGIKDLPLGKVRKLFWSSVQISLGNIFRYLHTRSCDLQNYSLFQLRRPKTCVNNFSVIHVMNMIQTPFTYARGSVSTIYSMIKITTWKCTNQLHFYRHTSDHQECESAVSWSVHRGVATWLSHTQLNLLTYMYLVSMCFSLRSYANALIVDA